MMASATTWQLREQEEIITGNETLLGETHFLVAMTRMRNEALILPDTLAGAREERCSLASEKDFGRR